jgi:4-hydroxy-4-methyl-2-oxoglutarate aldolase
MEEILTAEELEKLRRVTTPTIANAIERFHLRASDQGYTNSNIKCIFPDLGAIIGYASTAIIKSATPSTGKLKSRQPYWENILTIPAPRIAVVQDLDQPATGAYWGEVNANIHRALGCVGVITDGAVRDLDEVHALGFQFFANSVSVSHSFTHLEDYGTPVEIGGLKINPGDLIHADKHGACIIPKECAKELLSAVAAVEEYERPMIALCKSGEFTPAKMAELLKNETV